MQTEYVRAVLSNKSGMGGAFDAPNYPTHTHHVVTDLQRKPENRGGMAIEYALDEKYISPKLKEEIKSLIAAWHANKPPITDPSIQEWIKACLRHWAGTTGGTEQIQRFYPEFTNKII